MICRRLMAHGNGGSVLRGMLFWVGIAYVMSISGCDRVGSGSRCNDDTRIQPSLSQLLDDTGILIPEGAILSQSEQQNTVVDAASYYKITMSSQDAEALRHVLSTYPAPKVQVELPPRGAFDWWKHDSFSERYAVDMPNGNSVYAAYDFVDCSTTTILYVVIIPF